MANPSNPLLRRSVGTLRRTTKSAAGVSITYYDKSTKTSYPDIVATLDATRTEQETIDGLILNMKLQDFKIDVADLPVVPEKYDIITWLVRDGVTEVFQVLPLTATSSIENYDNYRQCYIIHTKQIPSENNPAVPVSAVGYTNLDGHAYTNKDSEAYTQAKAK